MFDDLTAVFTCAGILNWGAYFNY